VEEATTCRRLFPFIPFEVVGKSNTSANLAYLCAVRGLNEDTLQAIAVSNAVILVLHPDQQNIQSTAEQL
jgi:MinD-like ATPase involved in chromosome partitioning or flagellar assembly